MHTAEAAVRMHCTVQVGEGLGCIHYISARLVVWLAHLRGDKVATLPGFVVRASCPACSSKFVVCNTSKRVSKARRTDICSQTASDRFSADSPCPLLTGLCTETAVENYI